MAGNKDPEPRAPGAAEPMPTQLLTAGDRVVQYGAERALPARPSHRRWSVGEIIGEIRARLAAGKTLRSKRTAKEDVRLFNAGVHRYGSWQATLKAAGVPLKHRPRSKGWTRAELLAAMMRYAEEHGPFTATEITAHCRRINSVAVRLYGSVRLAAKAFGLPYKERWTAASVKRRIRERAAAGGAGAIRTGVVLREEPGLHRAARRCFGTWAAAKAAAGQAAAVGGRKAGRGK